MDKEIIVGELNFRNVLKKSKEIEFNVDFKNIFKFTETYKYEPFAMLYSASYIRTHKKDAVANLVVPTKSCNYEYACHMGYFKSLSPKIRFGKMPGEAKGSNTYIPVTKIDAEIDFKGEYCLGEAIERKSKELARILTQEEELSKIFTFCIREMLRNAIEHSEKSVVWICAQYWPMYNRAEIAILDEGIGVKSSLGSNILYKQDIHTTEDALKLSLEPGVSESKISKRETNPWANSGFGLYMASSICKKMGGSFLIASDDLAIYLKEEDAELLECNNYGTAIRMTMKTNNEYKCDEIIQEISKKGAELARKNRRNSQKPSKSSTKILT